MVENINHITLAVSDLEKSFLFYKDILGFVPKLKWENGAYFTVGNIWIALNKDDNIKDAEQKDYGHIAFSCSKSKFDKLKARLINYGTIEWNKNKSEGESFYFTDPDDHKLEIHIGDLESRLNSLKNSSSVDIEYF